MIHSWKSEDKKKWTYRQKQQQATTSNNKEQQTNKSSCKDEASENHGGSIGKTDRDKTNRKAGIRSAL